jgi:hypothetical protein
MHVFLFFPIHASCPASFILGIFTLIIFVEEYKSWIALCIFLHLPVTYSILGPNTVHDSLFLNTHSLKHNLLHQLVCCMLCRLSYILIFTLTHFGIHWCHLQGVHSFCSFFSAHPNSDFIWATSEWLKALDIHLLKEHNLKLTGAFFQTPWIFSVIHVMSLVGWL